MRKTDWAGLTRYFSWIAKRYRHQVKSHKICMGCGEFCVPIRTYVSRVSVKLLALTKEGGVKPSLVGTSPTHQLRHSRNRPMFIRYTTAPPYLVANLLKQNYSLFFMKSMTKNISFLSAYSANSEGPLATLLHPTTTHASYASIVA